MRSFTRVATWPASRCSSSTTATSRTVDAVALASRHCERRQTKGPSSNGTDGRFTGNVADRFTAGCTGQELLAKIEADERVGAVACVQESVGERRIGPNHPCQYLGPGDRTEG